jgi:hypothetical protein
MSASRLAKPPMDEPKPIEHDADRRGIARDLFKRHSVTAPILIAGLHGVLTIIGIPSV